MGLKAFLKQDGKTISSIGSEGKRFRQIIERKEGPNKRPTGPSIYLKPCDDHSSPTPAVPVELFSFDLEKREKEFVRVAKCCPICWTILDA